MPSAAEQLAANLKWSSFSKAIELKKRIFFTVCALVIYRLGTYIPVPGISSTVLAEIYNQNSQGIMGIFDMFSGGAFGRMTIFALNIMPYISASIIIQLMTTVSSYLKSIKEEGEYGRHKINQYTRYITVLIAIIQSWGISSGLEKIHGSTEYLVYQPGSLFRLTAVITLVSGTVFLMWLGEQITQKGIVNGTSIIIFTGIISGLPNAVIATLELGRTGILSTFAIICLILISISIVTFVVFIERAQRRIIVQYPKRQIGRKITEGQSSHLPIKINTSGVIPPIFASSLLIMPISLAHFILHENSFWLEKIISILGKGEPLYIILYISLILFFGFFYTSIIFDPEETAKNLKNNGGFILGIRPGKNTAQYFDTILTRITVIGGLYLSFICIIPELLIAKWSIPFYFGGTSLLIVITVTMDIISNIQSHLFASQYENLIRKSRRRKRIQ